MDAKQITDISIALIATYDSRLVFLSLVIAVIGSYTALDIAEQVLLAQGRSPKFWLSGGAIALGISIWAMHFVAMLAYQLPIPTTYVFSTVLISMAVAIIGSGVGLFFATRLQLGWLILSSAGIFVGMSIIAMHYIAMNSMRVAAEPTYDLRLVLLSDLFAIALSFTALWLTFHKSAKTIVSLKWVRKLGSGLLAGAAINSMHYIAMAGVSFYPSVKKLKLASSGISNYVLAITIAIATLIILLLALLASFFGQRLSAETARAEALRESEKRYQNLYDFAPDAYFTIATDGTIKSVNQVGADSLGYRKEELINRPFYNIIHETEREWVQQWIRSIFSEQLVSSEVELRKVRKDGSILWGRQRSQLPCDVNGKPIELRMICRDITDRKQMEEQLRQNAFQDPLTGLPNRILFMDRLGHALDYAKRHQDYLFAVLFIDLDHFKVVNDSLGHLRGDQLLNGVAHMLKSCLRPSDTVARLGGDEFTILVEDITDTGDAIKVVERVQEELASPFNLDGKNVLISASIGVAVITTGYENPESLLRDADIAMYKAKNQGGARYELFNPNMQLG